MTDIADRLRAVKEAAEAVLWEQRIASKHVVLEKALDAMPDPDAVGECINELHRADRLYGDIYPCFGKALAKLEETR